MEDQRMSFLLIASWAEVEDAFELVVRTVGAIVSALVVAAAEGRRVGCRLEAVVLVGVFEVTMDGRGVGGKLVGASVVGAGLGCRLIFSVATTVGSREGPGLGWMDGAGVGT
jgi:hypothetical protein